MSLQLDDASDGELAALAQGGLQQAYRVLADRHREAVYRLARVATGDSDEAVDVTQESFVAAFAALDRYDGQRSFRSWIARIALNKSRDWTRRRAVRRMFSFSMPDDGIDIRDDKVLPDDAAANRQDLARVTSAIAKLPGRQKDVLLLRTIEGMTQAETAQTLGISEKSVETRLYRARRALSALRETM